MIERKLICKKTNSTFNTNRTDNLDVCIYHLQLRNKVLPNSDDLKFWLSDNMICKNSINHVKSLLVIKNDM